MFVKVQKNNDEIYYYVFLYFLGKCVNSRKYPICGKKSKFWFYRYYIPDIFFSERLNKYEKLKFKNFL